MIQVYVPKTRHSEYEIAGQEFVKYYQAITGEALPIVNEDDGKSDIITFGGIAVNPLIARLVLNGKIPELGVRVSTEDYLIKTYFVEDRKILLLAGGLGRSTLYAVYHYFEKAYACRWYWDGEIVPKNTSRDVFEEISILERLKFAYRGLRYFVHRGCKRFQSEMWGFEDWKKEIDYLVKRKQNLFMLRIGQDDLFQRAFPDSVPYPTEETMDKLHCQDGQGFNDRRLFWSLEYRGELRKKVMKYARDRGLMVPEDCGTMTHWYSRTPIEFIEKEKPTFFGEGRTTYHDESGKVFDVREDRNFNFYTKLTETSIREYGGSDELFHTIGFGERYFSEDKEVNRRMKKYVYERFLQYLKEEHPQSKVLIASWDIFYTYQPDEAQVMFQMFDKEQCIVFDYASDTAIENNFTNWGVVNHFPYVFGCFAGYEDQNDTMGYYFLTEERMKTAKADEACKGIIMWPELVHSDILMWEFIAQNSLSEKVLSAQEIIEKLCAERYVQENETMLDLWKRFYPIITLRHWSPNTEKHRWRPQYHYAGFEWHYLAKLANGDEAESIIFDFPQDRALAAQDDAIYCLQKIAQISETALQNEFIRRDVTDMARTIIGRYAHVYLNAEAERIIACRKGENREQEVYVLGEVVKGLLNCLSDVLSTHEDFSLAATLRDINKTEKIYEGFEETFKNNTSCLYCRQNVYESVKELFIPENEVVQELLRKGAPHWTYGQDLKDEFKKASKEIFDKFQSKPLEEIDQEPKGDLKEAVMQAARILKENKL